MARLPRSRRVQHSGSRQCACLLERAIGREKARIQMARRGVCRRLANRWRATVSVDPSGWACVDADVYSRLVGDAPILSLDLATSFSGLRLAGRGTGEAPTREMYGSVRFRLNEAEFRLSDLLTVHGWNKSHEVSRVCFFNPLTDRSIVIRAHRLWLLLTVT